MENTKYVKFNKHDLENFKLLYKSAIEQNKDSFMYKGNEYLVAYAKYLIEFLESKFTKI